MITTNEDIADGYIAQTRRIGKIRNKLDALSSEIREAIEDGDGCIHGGWVLDKIKEVIGE